MDSSAVTPEIDFSMATPISKSHRLYCTIYRIMMPKVPNISSHCFFN